MTGADRKDASMAEIEIERRELDEVVDDYIREQLSWGGPLSSLLGRIDLSDGSAWAFVPTNADHERAHDFSNGGLFRVPDSDRVALPGGGYMLPAPKRVDGHLAMHVDRFLSGRDDRLCVLEDPFASADDPGMAIREEVSYFTVGTALYYFATREQELMQTTVDALRRPPSVKYLGVLSEPGSGTAAIKSGSELSTVDLAAIAFATATIIVGAYDGEGYVIWSKR
jgi:hypothetical protein